MMYQYINGMDCGDIAVFVELDQCTVIFFNDRILT